MVRSYQLKKGRYFVGDPGYLIKKTPAGDKFIEKLWDSFYSDMNSFHKLVIDHITIYVTRTAEGDGFFDGIATDTGAIAIIDINQVLNDDRFQIRPDGIGCHYVDVLDEDEVTVDNFNISFKSGFKVITNG
ncbi:MAG: hypothetical protein ACOX4W_06465 [Bacilli bacterium]